MGGNSEGILDLDLGKIRPRRRPLWAKLVRLTFKTGFFSVKVVLILALPFVLLVRGSVYSYQEMSLHTWTALGAGVAATLLLFLIYASWLWKRMTGKRKVKKPILERQEPTPAPAPQTEPNPLFPGSAEESDLDIPAFLRRQAN